MYIVFNCFLVFEVGCLYILLVYLQYVVYKNISIFLKWKLKCIICIVNIEFYFYLYELYIIDDELFYFIILYYCLI